MKTIIDEQGGSPVKKHRRQVFSSPVFDHCKQIIDVGIPAFVFEDGRVSIDPADAGLIEYGSSNARSIEEYKDGRKGC